MAPRINVTETARTLFELNRLAAKAGLVTSAHRLLKQPRQSDWPVWFEGIVELLAQGMPTHGDVPAEKLRRSLDRISNVPKPSWLSWRPVVAGGIPAEWISTDQSSAEILLLYLHGGGYVSGSPRTHRRLIGEIARAAGVRVLAPDYRLGPEFAFPAAVEDAWSVYWWLLEQGVNPSRLVIAGDSAGGGLTVALLLALREAGMPLPAAAVCLSPWFDLALHGATLISNDSRDYLSRHAINAAAAMYLGATDPHTPLASPLYADLRGLPPLLIQAGTAEMLLDDARRFARRAAQADVPVELELWENMVHVWHFLHPIEERARQAIRSIGRFVRAHTSTSATNGEGAALAPHAFTPTRR